MKVAQKLTLAMMLGTTLVIGANAVFRVREDIALHQLEMQQDHRQLGLGLKAAVGQIWEDDGEERALWLVQRANEREGSVQIRWVWLDATTGDPHGPRAPIAALAAVADHRDVVWVDEDAALLATYLPMDVPTGRVGAIEISESLEGQRERVRRIVMRAIAVTFAILGVSSLVAFGLGSWLVGRPVEAIIEAMRAIGSGDLAAAPAIDQQDEFGEIAEEIAAMCGRLAAAERRASEDASMRIMALEQLRHADRLRTVGQLAAGIAHELGTPLNVVAGRARMIARAEVDGAAARDSAGIVVEQADRMAHTIRQLLDFARARTPHMSREDVGALAAQAVDLMAPLAQKRGVSIAFSRGARAEAEVDAGQIQQVLTNLLLNAIHAMPNGGEVRVDVIRSQSDVRVDVIDDGVGMPPEVRSRLFEPFFTTKPVGEGTGLGLAVSWGIVAEHGGRIDVETEPGCGARFSVHIPVPT